MRKDVSRRKFFERVALGAAAAAGVPLLEAQEQAPPLKSEDVWAPFHVFVGSWEGTTTGQPGEGKVARQYGFVLNGKFVEERNTSTYPLQEKNPKGEVHEDWGLFSYDRGRKRFVLRQFHVEGFVNQYVQESISEDGKTRVFVSENIENIPSGWRARESYKVVSPDEIMAVFELAAPGKDFEVYSESRLKRKK
jgi:hypothetical protein